MKKVISMIVAFLLCFGYSFAEPLLSPEKTTEAINNLISAEPVDGMEQRFAYLESSDEFGLLVVSESFMDAAVASSKSGKETDDWRACKAMAYNMYVSMRSLLEAYGYSKNSLSILLYTSLEEEGGIYYAIGDTNGVDCAVIGDIITNDTEPVIEKTKQAK